MIHVNCPALEELVVDQFAFLNLSNFLQEVASNCSKMRAILLKIHQNPREHINLSFITPMLALEYFEMQLNTVIDDKLAVPLLEAFPNVRKFLLKAILYGSANTRYRQSSNHLVYVADKSKIFLSLTFLTWRCWNYQVANKIAFAFLLKLS